MSVATRLSALIDSAAPECVNELLRAKRKSTASITKRKKVRIDVGAINRTNSTEG